MWVKMWPFPVGLSASLQDTGKALYTIAVLGRKVGAAKERFSLRREKDRHGPAPPPGKQLHGAHVDFIQIGPLFSIHFDIHKVLVHQGGDLLVLK